MHADNYEPKEIDNTCSCNNLHLAQTFPWPIFTKVIVMAYPYMYGFATDLISQFCHHHRLVSHTAAAAELYLARMKKLTSNLYVRLWSWFILALFFPILVVWLFIKCGSNYNSQEWSRDYMYAKEQLFFTTIIKRWTCWSIYLEKLMQLKSQYLGAGN